MDARMDAARLGMQAQEMAERGKFCVDPFDVELLPCRNDKWSFLYGGLPEEGRSDNAVYTSHFMHQVQIPTVAFSALVYGD